MPSENTEHVVYVYGQGMADRHVCGTAEEARDLFFDSVSYAVYEAEETNIHSVVMFSEGKRTMFRANVLDDKAHVAQVEAHDESVKALEDIKELGNDNG